LDKFTCDKRRNENVDVDFSGRTRIFSVVSKSQEEEMKMMQKPLAARIKHGLRDIKRCPDKAKARIFAELNRDLILPTLKIRKNVAIMWVICPDEYVKGEASLELQIGPRDWSFDLKTGELIGCGTQIGPELHHSVIGPKPIQCKKCGLKHSGKCPPLN